MITRWNALPLPRKVMYGAIAVFAVMLYRTLLLDSARRVVHPFRPAWPYHPTTAAAWSLAPPPNVRIYQFSDFGTQTSGDSSRTPPPKSTHSQSQAQSAAPLPFSWSQVAFAIRLSAGSSTDPDSSVDTSGVGQYDRHRKLVLAARGWLSRLPAHANVFVWVDETRYDDGTAETLIPPKQSDANAEPLSPQPEFRAPPAAPANEWSTDTGPAIQTDDDLFARFELSDAQIRDLMLPPTTPAANRYGLRIVRSAAAASDEPEAPPLRADATAFDFAAHSERRRAMQHYNLLDALRDYSLDAASTIRYFFVAEVAAFVVPESVVQLIQRTEGVAVDAAAPAPLPHVFCAAPPAAGGVPAALATSQFYGFNRAGLELWSLRKRAPHSSAADSDWTRVLPGILHAAANLQRERLVFVDCGEFTPAKAKWAPVAPRPPPPPVPGATLTSLLSSPPPPRTIAPDAATAAALYGPVSMHSVMFLSPLPAGSVTLLMCALYGAGIALADAEPVHDFRGALTLCADRLSRLASLQLPVHPLPPGANRATYDPSEPEYGGVRSNWEQHTSSHHNLAGIMRAGHVHPSFPLLGLSDFSCVGSEPEKFLPARAAGEEPSGFWYLKHLPPPLLPPPPPPPLHSVAASTIAATTGAPFDAAQYLFLDRRSHLNWSDLCLIMLTTDSAFRRRALGVMMRTWISRLPPDAHIVLVTDMISVKDGTSAEEAAVLRNAFVTKTIAGYREQLLEAVRSSRCVGLPAASCLSRPVRTPQLDVLFYPHASKYLDITTKVFWSLTESYARFPASKWFWKLDDDSYLIPAHLFALLSRIQSITHDQQPLSLGRVWCNDRRVCYGMGLGYGMNAYALRELTYHRTATNRDAACHSPAVLTTTFEDQNYGRCMIMATGSVPLHCGGVFNYDSNELAGGGPGITPTHNPALYHHFNMKTEKYYHILDKAHYRGRATTRDPIWGASPIQWERIGMPLGRFAGEICAYGGCDKDRSGE